FRNASSLAANRKVVDTPFMEYMHSRPGIVVLRAE
ncbi:N-acetylmuramoyl-L-alanine amidase-like domain-containing protein, partial [Salmonella enterica]